jgi:hypothetical protein
MMNRIKSATKICTAVGKKKRENRTSASIGLTLALEAKIGPKIRGRLHRSRGETIFPQNVGNCLRQACGNVVVEDRYVFFPSVLLSDQLSVANRNFGLDHIAPEGVQHPGEIYLVQVVPNDRANRFLLVLDMNAVRDFFSFFLIGWLTFGILSKEDHVRAQN